MSTVVYNDVELKLVKTKRFEQTPQYDDTGIDYLITDSSSTSCIFNADAMTGNGATPTQIMTSVRGSLLEARRTFLFKVGDETLLNVSVPDAKGGPYPQNCDITQINGTKTFLSIGALRHVLGCARAVLRQKNTGRAIQSVDADANVQRTLLCDAHHQRQSYRDAVGDIKPRPLDAFRHLGMPSLPRGWRRRSCQFAISQDGLSLNYNIEDEELTTVPKLPATAISGRYSEITSSMATQHFAEVSVDVSGPPNASKKDLVGIASEVVLEDYE
ncbi:MAG: hypothetical protein U1D30_19605 [Planctomycetota bacterium]